MSKIQEKYIRLDGKMKTSDLDAKFIRKMENNCESIVAAMTKDSLKNNDLEFFKSLDSDSVDNFSPILKQVRKRAEADAITTKINAAKDPCLVDAVFKDVKDNLIENNLYYNDSKVLDEILKVTENENNVGKTELKLVQISLQRIKKLPSDKRPALKEKAIDDLKVFEKEFLD